MRITHLSITGIIIAALLLTACDSMTSSEADLNQQEIRSSELLDSAVKSGPTKTVSGDTFNPGKYSGWLFNRDQSTQTPYIFTFEEESIGNGSLYVEPIKNTINDNNDKFIGELYLDEEIANIESLSYDFLIGSGGETSDANHFYLNVYANYGESDFDKFYDCRYDIVPSSGSTTDWTTVTFDPTQSYSVNERGSSPYPCPSVPADMDDDSPGSTIRVAAINVGDTSGDDLDLDGYYDNVIVDLNKGAATTYDFEPDCKDGNWEDFGFKNQGQCERFENTGKDSR